VRGLAEAAARRFEVFKDYTTAVGFFRKPVAEEATIATRLALGQRVCGHERETRRTATRKSVVPRLADRSRNTGATRIAIH
jgi:hypothetical protein